VRVTASPCPSAESAPIHLGLYPLPVTSEITGAATSEQDKTESYSVAATAGSSYLWTLSDGTVVTGQGTAAVSVKWPSLGTSAVIGVRETSSRGCNGAVVRKTVTLNPSTVGIGELQWLSDIRVYPIPANDRIYVSLVSSSAERLQLKIKDMLGKEVSGKNAFNIVIGINELAINVREIPDGIYVMQIEGKSEVHEVRIVVGK
jgi:hypothetical protein